MAKSRLLGLSIAGVLIGFILGGALNYFAIAFLGKAKADPVIVLSCEAATVALLLVGTVAQLLRRRFGLREAILFGFAFGILGYWALTLWYFR